MTSLSVTYGSPLQARNGFMGIYVHYPYCFKKCDYCDFYSEGIGKDPSPNENALFQAYRKEFLFRKQNSPSLQSNLIDTIFMGGGTPSKASPREWKHLIDFFKNEVNVHPDAEISLEANPEDLTPEFVEELYDAGINRLNVGVQTRNAKGLAFLGRHVDEEKYDRLESLFASSRIQRLGIDLMYGIPELSSQSFLEDLDFFLKLKLQHLSLYSLTLEKGTSYSRKVKDKILKPPDEEIQRQILEFLPGKLKENGYIWYEVSNYALPNQFSRHNLRYWMYEPYLGIGPGAHGFLDKRRYGNPRNTETYLKDPGRAKQEAASPREEIALSLFRLFLPMDVTSFFQMHLSSMETQQFLQQIEKIHRKGYCHFDGQTFQWNSSALFELDDLILELTEAD